MEEILLCETSEIKRTDHNGLLSARLFFGKEGQTDLTACGHVQMGKTKKHSRACSFMQKDVFVCVRMEYEVNPQRIRSEESA